MRYFLLIWAILCVTYHMEAQKRTIDIVGDNGSVQHIEVNHIAEG